MRSLAGVRDEARRAAKGILVELTASWCEPCAVFEREILPTPQFQAALRDVIFVRWDIDRSWGEDDYERELVGYSAVPFFVVLDEDGVIRGTYRGLHTPPTRRGRGLERHKPSFPRSVSPNGVPFHSIPRGRGARGL